MGGLFSLHTDETMFWTLSSTDDATCGMKFTNGL